MAYRFTERAVPGVFDCGPFRSGSSESYVARAGSFTIVYWPDGTARFGAPTEIAWLTDIDQLPDMVNLPYPCISTRLRDLIERFEPGVHDFYPVRVTMKNGDTEQRYLLQVIRAFDAVSETHSNWTRKFESWERPPSREKRLVFDARLIGDAHLWRDPGLRTEMNPIASDALADAARAVGITGLLLDHYEQTDSAGNYDPQPLSPDRIYVVYEQPRLSRDGNFALTIKVKLLDGKPDEVRIADDPEGKLMKLRYAAQKGRKLDPSNVPTRAYYYQNTKGAVPDVFVYSDLPLTVSTRLKELIERFEPGIHQFLPIAFVNKQGEVTEDRHILVIGALLNTWSRQHSTMLGDRGAPYNPGHEQGTIVIERKTVAGRHVWLDQWLAGDLFVSNDIAAIMEASGWPNLAFGGYDLVG